MIEHRQHDAAWDAEAAREFVRPVFWQRALGGLRRRLSARPATWSAAVAGAVTWLRDYSAADGLATAYGPGLGDPVFCPGTTAAGVVTLAAYGELPLARGKFEPLLSRQRADGAIVDATGQSASLVNTGRFVAAALALGMESTARQAVARAAGFLAARIDLRGRPQPDRRAAGSLDAVPTAGVHLSWAPALSAAADALGEPRLRSAGERMVSHLTRSGELTSWEAPLTVHLQGLLALAQLRMLPVVRAAMTPVAAAQARDGSLPETPHARWTSGPALGLAARIWSILGEQDRADRALAALVSAQWSSGGWPGSWGSRAGYFPHHAASWSAICFLDAVQERVASAFAGETGDVPARVDPRDGRAEAVRRWAEALDPTARIADVGCGRGRYLRIVEEVRPRARLVAIDPSRDLLTGLSSRVARRTGGLLRLPAADGEFDAVLAVESLEHALLPERAIAELARSVRAGGSILVIDKDQSRQARSRHAPWERWFQPAEMNHWLTQFCDEVSARPIAHGPNPQPDGLYWLWIGHKRAAAIARAA